MPPRGVGLWFFPTVDFCGARLAQGGIVVLLKEQRVTLRLRGIHRSLCLMRGSWALYVMKTNSSHSFG